MPSKKDFIQLMKDATAFADDYRRTNIDPAHRRADTAYHSILENEADYAARGRSSLFIPKTFDHCRKWASNVVNSFYLSDDIVSVSYPPDDAKQRFTNEVLNIRLEGDTVFYRFLCHAADAHVKYGNVVAKTGWEYSEKAEKTEDVDPETGERIVTEVMAPEIDSPFFELIPFENMQYDYRVISHDPIEASPFLRQWIPMYLGDVDEKFKSGEWKKPRAFDWETIKVPASTDTVRLRRQGKMADPSDKSYGSGDDTIAGRAYRQVWVVENYFRVSGTDWTFISLGDEHVATSPERVVDKFPHGRRPFAMSQFHPEAFRSYSQGIPEMFRFLQAEENAIRNQRRDNVALVLNAGHIVRRGAGIHIPSLQNSRSGRIIMGDSIEPKDIRREEVADVTASSYREEEITQRDIEELSGRSQNTLGVGASDRQTATEAAIKASSAGELEGYVIKGFVETFIRPLLEMFYDNVVAFENDQDVLFAAERVTGVPASAENLARGELVVNAGMGSVNKELRANRLDAIINQLIQLAAVDPQFAQAAGMIMKERLPLAGLKNVDKYFPMAQGPQTPGGIPALPPAQAGPPSAGEPPGASPATGVSPAGEGLPGGIGGLARGMIQ